MAESYNARHWPNHQEQLGFSAQGHLDMLTEGAGDPTANSVFSVFTSLATIAPTSVYHTHYQP